MESQSTVKNERGFSFDWMVFDPEIWRGPKLSFPISAELVVVPEFNELVVAATDSFGELELVDPEETHLRVLQDYERGAQGEEPFNDLGESDLGLRLTYFEGDVRDLVFNLRHPNADDLLPRA